MPVHLSVTVFHDTSFFCAAVFTGVHDSNLDIIASISIETAALLIPFLSQDMTELFSYLALTLIMMIMGYYLNLLELLSK